MLGMLGFGPQPIIDISLDNLKKRAKQSMKINNNQVKVPIYTVDFINDRERTIFQER